MQYTTHALCYSTVLESCAVGAARYKIKMSVFRRAATATLKESEIAVRVSLQTLFTSRQ